MSESWDRVRRRHELVDDVLGEVHREGPVAMARWHGQLEREYGEEGLDGFLRDVQRRWQRAFDARLDAVLESPADDVEESVVDLWRTVAALLPASRQLLDTYADHPALVRGHERQRRMLMVATGVDLREVLAAQPEPRVAQPCRFRRRAARGWRTRHRLAAQSA